MVSRRKKSNIYLAERFFFADITSVSEIPLPKSFRPSMNLLCNRFFISKNEICPSKEEAATSLPSGLKK